MTINELNQKYFTTSIRRKSKGAGKGHKEYVEVRFNELLTRREYIRELSEVDSLAAGKLLCRIEFDDLVNDRWWDAPNYRESHLKEYRSRITAIRKEYGLRSVDISEFMRV